MSDSRKLIAHILFRLDYGGLENGVVNVTNTMSGDVGHVIVALTDATDFKKRVAQDVEVYALGKKPGKDLRAYVRLYRLLRKLRPTAVHTRNIGTLDCAVVAFLAGIRVRIHGEHGWDMFDPQGNSRKYRTIRRFLAPFVQIVVAVSEDLRVWLRDVVQIRPEKIRRIYNGVDTNRFLPGDRIPISSLPAHFRHRSTLVIGTVTRFSAIKDPMNLARAFVEFQSNRPADAEGTGLIMVGDGELHEEIAEYFRTAGMEDRVWLPGARDDIAELLRRMDIFVLGSVREGISNTILEAMSTGLPVIATDTGGNSELVVDGITGALVPVGNSSALTDAIATYVCDPVMRKAHGDAGRCRVVDLFSLTAMIRAYQHLYNEAFALRGI